MLERSQGYPADIRFQCLLTYFLNACLGFVFPLFVYFFIVSSDFSYLFIKFLPRCQRYTYTYIIYNVFFVCPDYLVTPVS